MRKWFKRRSYVRSAMNDIQALTYMIGVDEKSLKKHQGVKQAIIKNFSQGIPSPVAAVRVAGTLLADAIERDLAQDRKRAIGRALTDWLESDNPLSSIRKRPNGRGPDQDVVLTCLQWAVLRALDLVSDGRIGANDFEVLKSEICGALSGTLHEQRSARRLAQRFRPTSDLAIQ